MSVCADVASAGKSIACRVSQWHPVPLNAGQHINTAPKSCAMLAAPSQRARARQAGSLLHLFQVSQHAAYYSVLHLLSTHNCRHDLLPASYILHPPCTSLSSQHILQPCYCAEITSSKLCLPDPACARHLQLRRGCAYPSCLDCLSVCVCVCVKVLTALLTWQLRAELAATSSAELVATSVPYLTLP